MEAIGLFPATSCVQLLQVGPVQLSDLTADILGITPEKPRRAHQATRQLPFAVRTSSISCLLHQPKSTIVYAKNTHVISTKTHVKCVRPPICPSALTPLQVVPF